MPGIMRHRAKAGRIGLNDVIDLRHSRAAVDDPSPACAQGAQSPDAHQQGHDRQPEYLEQYPGKDLPADIWPAFAGELDCMDRFPHRHEGTVRQEYGS
jgi:hypothetical protein